MAARPRAAVAAAPAANAALARHLAGLWLMVWLIGIAVPFFLWWVLFGTGSGLLVAIARPERSGSVGLAVTNRRLDQARPAAGRAVVAVGCPVRCRGSGGSGVGCDVLARGPGPVEEHRDGGG